MSHANAPLTPEGRRRLAVLVVDRGWSLRRVAERFQCSPATAKRWVDRYRSGSPLIDRSSKPHSSPGRLPRKTEHRIVSLRFTRRWGPHRMGCIGPRADGYVASGRDADEAAEFHVHQIRALADAGADLVHAMTMSEPAEAIGVVRAARSAGVPVAVSFTVETDGRLPDGSTIAEALGALDAVAPADFYGLNCAHPTHVLAALDDGDWRDRLTFLRPNASTLSHAELDDRDSLDAGDLPHLVATTSELLDRLPHVAVLGGCCGTDHRHIAALWAATNLR